MVRTMSNRDHTGTDTGTVTFEVAFDEDLWLDILEAAAYGGSRYWADISLHSDDPDNDGWNYAKVREVIDDWVTPVEYGVETAVTASDMFAGAQKLTHPSSKVAAYIKRDVAGLLIDPDGVDWDAETADCILQFAVFGELVYG